MKQIDSHLFHIHEIGRAHLMAVCFHLSAAVMILSQIILFFNSQ